MTTPPLAATTALDPRVTCPVCATTWMPLHGDHPPMRLIDPWRTQREQHEQEDREMDEECR